MKKSIVYLGVALFITGLLWVFDQSVFQKNKDSDSHLDGYIFKFNNKTSRQVSSLNEVDINTKGIILTREDRKLDSELLKLIAEVNELNMCYQVDCFGDSDYQNQYELKSNYFKIGQKIKNKMISIYEKIQEESVSSDQIIDFALQQLQQTDGHVQDVALDILSTQKTSVDILHKIIESIIHGQDPTLIQQALLELNRYQGFEEQIYIQSQIRLAILHGSPFISEALSQNAALFINNRNIEFYEKVIESLQASSKVRQNIIFTIQEINRKNQS